MVKGETENRPLIKESIVRLFTDVLKNQPENFKGSGSPFLRPL